MHASPVWEPLVKRMPLQGRARCQKRSETSNSFLRKREIPFSLWPIIPVRLLDTQFLTISSYPLSSSSFVLFFHLPRLNGVIFSTRLDVLFGAGTRRSHITVAASLAIFPSIYCLFHFGATGEKRKKGKKQAFC